MYTKYNFIFKLNEKYIIVNMDKEYEYDICNNNYYINMFIIFYNSL